MKQHNHSRPPHSLNPLPTGEGWGGAWEGWGGAVVLFFLLFSFYHFLLPYHLFHREQTQLFLMASEPLADYWRHPAALARLAGDFLTQFFYYEGVGPALLALALTLWGMVVHRLLRPYLGRWAWVPTVLAVVWEGGRQCGLTHPLSSTLAWAGIGGVLLLCRGCIRRWQKVGWAMCLPVLAVGYWLFGCGDGSGKWWDKPRFDREYLLALDSETYFGRRAKVAKLLAENAHRRSAFSTYYENLHQAQQHDLPGRWLGGPANGVQSLFLPVAPGSNYLSIYAANEVWFALGDMTMAEHAAILGMIFSPQHTGTRALRRLAEINLINGDEAAAMKYLRLLRQTVCHRTWAESRLPGRQTPEVRQWLERKRALLPTKDTLRSSANVPLSLRHLLRSCPDNRLACNYMLCIDLLCKDIAAFADDYRAFVPADRPMPRLYAEAMLIYLAWRQVPREEVERWNFPDALLHEFNDYTRLYESSGGKDPSLRGKYGGTYWHYFHSPSQPSPVGRALEE